MSEQLIKTPVTVEVTKTYGGDIPTMSGGMEVGFWTEKFIICDATGRPIVGGLEDEATVRAIAKVLNEHTALVAVAEAAEAYFLAAKDLPLGITVSVGEWTAQHNAKQELSAELAAWWEK